MSRPTRVRISACCAATLLLAVGGQYSCAQQGTEDRVAATTSGGRFVLRNRAIKASVSTTDGKLSGLSITDPHHGTELAIERPFELLLKNGAIYYPGNLPIHGEAKLHELN